MREAPVKDKSVSRHAQAQRRSAKDFYGTNPMSFSATHYNPALGINITRSFTHFSQAIAEIRLARMYGGIHFVTADAQGATLGRKVAKWRDEHYFQPAA